MAAPFAALAPTDRLHLTCTRLGTCCHGHQIFICPWELAQLAHGKGLGVVEFRDRFTDCGGTRLIFNGAPLIDGPPSHQGKPACSLYDGALGCTVHPQRPLVCRLYPLARGRHEGQTIYHFPGERLPCHLLCPSVDALPVLQVGEYIAGQALRPGEIAHDAYAALAYGMINAARLIALRAPNVDGKALQEHFRRLRALTPLERPSHIPAHWIGHLTAPLLPLPLEDPAAFASAHGQYLAHQLQGEFGSSQAPDALSQAARLYLVIGLHLGTAVGTDAEVMQHLLENSEIA